MLLADELLLGAGSESGDDDEDGGGVEEEEEEGDDRGVAEGGILGGVLLYWLLRLHEGHVLLAPSGPSGTRRVICGYVSVAIL
jgi:hypothetical protein